MDAIIITTDTLQALGIRYVLDKFFNMSAVMARSLSDVDLSGITPQTLFVASPECVAASMDFFMLRRNNTVLLVSSPLAVSDFNVLIASQDESNIIDVLNAMVTKLRNMSPAVSASELSQREIEVLRLVALGYINKEIADKLSISINTVLSHRKNISAKLGIRSASGWSFYALMNGLIDATEPRR